LRIRPVDAGLLLIIPVGGLVSVDRSRNAITPVLTRVVKTLDVIEHVGLRLGAIAIDLSVGAFGLRRTAMNPGFIITPKLGVREAGSSPKSNMALRVPSLLGSDGGAAGEP
jgi:hypothetical protein